MASMLLRRMAWISGRSGCRRAVERVGTPCYVVAWAPIRGALRRLEALAAPCPVRSWLSFKTHPLDALADEWLRFGPRRRSRQRTRMLRWCSNSAPASIRCWSTASPSTRGCRGIAVAAARALRFAARAGDAAAGLRSSDEWRVGMRVQAPDECDRARPAISRPVRLLATPKRSTRCARLQRAGAIVESVHFHLGQRPRSRAPTCVRSIIVADVCEKRGVAPTFFDCGGGLPAAHDPASRRERSTIWPPRCSARRALPALRERSGSRTAGSSPKRRPRWRFACVDIKERDECRYLICDGGRTNHALAADAQAASDAGDARSATAASGLTTICGPTCMTDDRLGRWFLPECDRPSAT